MKNRRCTRFLIGAALFYCSLAGVCQSVYAQPEMRFRLVRGTFIVISVMANDEGPFDFLLDTGTDTTLVDPYLGRRLSLVPVDQIELHTLAGTRMLVRSRLGSLGAGDGRVQDVEVLVQDLAELRKVDSRIEGVAGQNFLSHFNYLLDYRQRMLRIETGDEIRNALEGERVPLEVRENKMMVDSESPEGARLRLELDSAANSLVLVRRASQVFQVAGVQDGLEDTTAGQFGLQVGRVRELTVGTQQFHDIPAALPAAQALDSERIEDGLLPTALFRSLYVNNRDKFVVFNPRIKKN